MLEADGIQLAFGARQVLAHVYLRVETGQVVGLLGRNGSGKSTLLQTVFGARAVPDASVRVDGHRAVPAFTVPGLVNYLPQAGGLLPAHLPLRQAARLLGTDPEKATARFPALRAQLNCRPGDFSGGTLRLLQVLLLHADTAFSLLDEPFTGIMPVHLETLADEIRDARQRKGILLTDHRYAEVLSLCNVVYLLREGRLLKLGPDPRAELCDYGYLAA